MTLQNLIQSFKDLWKRKAVVSVPNVAPKTQPGALSWSFSQAWNQSLIVRPERPLIVRDYVWASEIGGAMIDRYLRMTGVPQSNAPNNRSLRKFQAGDIWEWICAAVLKRAGILIETQTKLSYQYPNLLRVSGKLDFLAGGQPDWRKARKELDFLGLPEMLQNASTAIINQLESAYGNDPLKTIVLEIKSTSSFMYAKYEKTGQANSNHRCQTFHYLKSQDMHEGHVVYVCRDDCMLLEFGVFNPSLVEDEYKADLSEITDYVLTGTKPPKEKEILFDDRMFRFEKNWKIEYSNYLTYLYSYNTPMEYRERVDKSVASYNRTFKRCVTNAKITDLNLQVIKDAKQTFPLWDDWVDRAKIVAAKNPTIIEDEERAA